MDYSVHYEMWHSEKTKDTDIKATRDYLKLHKILPANKNVKILDIGCGRGFLLHALITEGYTNCLGIDNDKQQIEYAIRDNLNVQCSDAISFMSEAEEFYDLIFLIDVLEHVEKKYVLNLLKIIYKKLSDDGCLFIQIPNALSPVAMYYRYVDWTHNTTFVDINLQFLLRSASYKTINIREATPPNLDNYTHRNRLKKMYKTEIGNYNPIVSQNIACVAWKGENTNVLEPNFCTEMFIKKFKGLHWLVQFCYDIVTRFIPIRYIAKKILKR